MYFRTEGVILLQRNLGEADKLLTIYTRDYGKLTCIAKGVRKPTSRKSGHIELGNWCKVFVARGKNIDLLAEVEVKKAFGIENLTGSRANYIYHLLEIVNLLTPQNQKSTQVFFLIIKFLNEVSRGRDFNLVSSVFKVKLLKNLGYFSTANLASSNLKKFLTEVENEDYKNIYEKVHLDNANYLKLLAFLDSMIENLTERKLKTTRFINGQI